MGLSAFLSTQVIDTTSVGRSVMTAVDAAAARTALGLGTLATQSGTFSGTSSGTNTGDQTITLTGDVTGSGTGSFATTIANSAVTNAMLAGSIAISKLAITGTPDGTKFLRDDGTWAAASGGSGLTSLNGLTGSTQTFAVGTSGTDFAISSTGTAHTFNIPDASASARGLVTTAAQTLAGDKTFTGTLIGDANIFSNNTGGTATIGIRNGSGAGNRIQMLYGTGFQMASTYAVTWSPNSTNVNSPDLFLYRDAAGTLAQRNSTNAQTFNIANTWTSSTNFEYGRFQWNTNEFRIGTAVGSAGGTLRSTVLGSTTSAGVWRPAITIAGSNSTEDTTLPNILVSKGNSISGYITINAVGGGSFYTGDTNSATAGVFFVGTTANSSASATSHRFAVDPVNSVVHIGGFRRAVAVDGLLTSSYGTGTDVAGSSLLIAGGRGTGTGAGGSIQFQVAAAGSSGTSLNALATRLTIDSTGNCTFAPGASSSGSQTGFTFTAPAPTGQTASTEATMFNVNLASTVQFAAGALTTQRAFRIQAPTYAFASASTITTASTLSISGAPIAGTNATITNAYALNVESGSSNFQRIFVTDGTNSFESTSWGGGGLVVRSSGNPVVGLGPGGIRLTAGAQISFCSDAAINTPEIGLIRDAANALAQRSSTNAQTFNIANTWTSSTSFEYGRFQWSSNEWRIGTAVGSAGGTGRSLVLGSWNSAGTWTAALTVSAASTTVAVSGNITLASQITFNSDTALRRISAGIVEVNNGTAGQYRDLVAGNLSLIQVAATSGSPTQFSITGAAHTTLTASTEATDVNFNLARTVQFAAGAITTQRAFRIQAPTYAFASASTITSAATLSISGAPVAGTNATLTNSYALWVENGMSQFSGIINTAAAVVINLGSQAFNTSFHFVSWNGGFLGWSSSGTVNSTSSLDTAFKRVSAGLVEINNGTAGTYRDLVLRNLRMSTPTVPATASDTGSEGQISWDANYIYVCTATNTWKRAALATW